MIKCYECKFNNWVQGHYGGHHECSITLPIWVPIPDDDSRIIYHEFDSGCDLGIDVEKE